MILRNILYPYFLTFRRVFDFVDHKVLLKKLHHYHLRGVTLDFFKSYLHDRKQFTMVNGVSSDWLTVICGVPQGSVLGPLLFLLYTNDLANSTNFSINLFADDTCLSMSCTNLNELNRKCNIEATSVDNWFRANRLTTNSKKKQANFYSLNIPLEYPSIKILIFVLKWATLNWKM